MYGWNFYGSDVIKFKRKFDELRTSMGHEYVDLGNQLNLGRGRVGKVR